MAPLPATPVTSRFLLSKRQTTQSHTSQTLNQQHGIIPQLLYITPRFASTPRPSSAHSGAVFATPALAIKTRGPRTRSTQDIIDVSSPVSDNAQSPPLSPTTSDTLPEPIEIDSSLLLESSLPEEPETYRASKRRRISIASSSPETYPVTSPDLNSGSDIESLPDAPDEDNDHRPSSSHSRPFSEEEEEEEEEEERVQTVSDDETPRPPSPVSSSSVLSSSSPPPSSPDLDPSRPRRPPQPNHPHTTTSKEQQDPARRFKPHPHQTTDPDYLPQLQQLPDLLFSPQRRGGPKYLPGGLAAELRDWLVEVKEGADVVADLDSGQPPMSEHPRAAPSAVVMTMMRVRVEAVRRGGVGMTLVAGRQVGSGPGRVGPDGDSQGRGREGERDAVELRVMLAGEGMVQGLGGGDSGGNLGRVVPGAVVAVAPPTWEVELGADGRWAVAYRWEVVREGGG